MFHREILKTIPEEIGLGENALIEISAVHYTDKVLLQLRLNGELDTTYEVVSKGLSANDLNPVALSSDSSYLEEDVHDGDLEYMPVRDNLSNFHVIARLGDSNDMKLPIVCTQIAELYQRVIFPANVDSLQMETHMRGFVISLSAKIWKKCKTGGDFTTLVFILQTIKEMYDL